MEKTEIIDGRVFVMVVYDFEEAKLKAKQAVEIELKREEEFSMNSKPGKDLKH